MGICGKPFYQKGFPHLSKNFEKKKLGRFAAKAQDGTEFETVD